MRWTGRQHNCTLELRHVGGGGIAFALSPRLDDLRGGVEIAATMRECVLDNVVQLDLHTVERLLGN